MYFCGVFDSPATYQLVGQNSTSKSGRLGALFTFNDTEVTSRVGVSFLSESQACNNLRQETPKGISIDKLRQQTRSAWNEQVFSKITTTETNTTKLQQLYSAMYFMHLLPQNKTGENPLYKSTEPYYDDIFTFWDTVSTMMLWIHLNNDLMC